MGGQMSKNELGGRGDVCNCKCRAEFCRGLEVVRDDIDNGDEGLGKANDEPLTKYCCYLEAVLVEACIILLMYVPSTH